MFWNLLLDAAILLCLFYLHLMLWFCFMYISCSELHGQDYRSCSLSGKVCLNRTHKKLRDQKLWFYCNSFLCFCFNQRFYVLYHLTMWFMDKFWGFIFQLFFVNKIFFVSFLIIVFPSLKITYLIATWAILDIWSLSWLVLIDTQRGTYLYLHSCFAIL